MAGGKRRFPKTTHSWEVSGGEGGGEEKGKRRGRETDRKGEEGGWGGRGGRWEGRSGEKEGKGSERAAAPPGASLHASTQRKQQGFLVVVVVCGVKYRIYKDQKLSLESARICYCIIWKQMRRLSA